MRYVLVGLAFGLAWAAMQLFRDQPIEPAAMIVAVAACGLFGAVLWGIRALTLRWRRGRGA
jgi:hypothetical protein